MSVGTCNIIDCASGFIALESVILGLFATDTNGCTGLKIVQLTETDCANLTPVVDCGTIVTAEQAIKMAIVDDGCGGYALGVFYLSELN